MPRNLHSPVHKVTLLVDYIENGFKDATWRGDGESSEIGLQIPSRITVDSNIRINLHPTLSLEYVFGKSLRPTLSKKNIKNKSTLDFIRMIY